jgi:hypothetical protein
VLLALRSQVDDALQSNSNSRTVAFLFGIG